MKQLASTPLSCIEKKIIGKITHKPINRFMRKNFVLVSSDNNKNPGYAAVLTAVNNSKQHLKTPTFLCNPDDIAQLIDGDIVAIEKDGGINVLYEIGSAHNFILVTERCNCSCIMCPNPLVMKVEEKANEALKIISLIDKSAQTLGITGGEPTLLGDKLVDIITVCRKKLPHTGLIILTNGIKFESFDYVKKIVSAKHQDLTIDIPIYSDTDTEHNKIIGADGLYKTIAGIYNLARFKQKVGLRIVVHKLNYKRLPQIAEFI